MAPARRLSSWLAHLPMPSVEKAEHWGKWMVETETCRAAALVYARGWNPSAALRPRRSPALSGTSDHASPPSKCLYSGLRGVGIPKGSVWVPLSDPNASGEPLEELQRQIWSSTQWSFS